MTKEEITKLFYDKCSVRNGKDIVLLDNDIEVIANFIVRMFEHLNKKLADLDKENEWLSQFTMKCKLHENDLLKEFVEFIKGSWSEEIKIYEELEKDAPFMAREAIKSKLIGMRKMLGLLDNDLEQFLEEKE